MTRQRHAPPPPRRRSRRFYRALFFFARAAVGIVLRDILCNRSGLRWLRGDAVARWTRLAERFRQLALDLGGIWIKLGQYFSTRVDILPREVTRALSNLQDEVPAESFDDIRQSIEDELGKPLQELFSSFSERPLGAASFAQAHEAQLPGGAPVVVKVLRPGIEEIVETDLRALSITLSWFEFWPAVRKRVDLEWVEEEFSSTTRRELDLRQEAEHVERFAENFAGDDGVHAPRIEWPFTSRRVLTEENVAYIKITDIAALRANGIEPKQVAKKLYLTFMEQIFTHNFVHADPHPGNIFVRPMNREPSILDEAASRASEAAAYIGAKNPPFGGGGTPFQLLFIDFGMMAEIPQRLRSALRTFLIGVASRDAAAVIQALRDSGSLLPGADLAQLEEALETVFDRFWGVDMARIKSTGLQEAASLWREFGDLLLETPIQVQADFMFTGRAVELLSGITSLLDEEFNPWDYAIPFAQKMAFEEFFDWRTQGQDLARQLRSLSRLPGEITRTAGLLQRGRLTVRTALSPEMRRRVQGLERGLWRLESTVLAMGVLIAGAAVYGSDAEMGRILIAGGGVLALLSRFLRR